MKGNKQSFLRVTIMLAIGMMIILVVAISSLFFSAQALASTRNAPLAVPAAAPLPAETCTLSGSGRACELWAKEGSFTLPDGGSVPIWGFADTATGTAQLPGSPIIVNQGETVTVTLHNEMASETVSLMFFGQEIVPDMTGAAPGETKAYSFTATEPGTFRYEAGLTPNGARQVAMGMYGALIVRPAVNPTGQAYEDTNSTYNQEALLVLSEIDPAFNTDPNNFDMTLFKPAYWLINGNAYSQTEKIEAATGETVLLRYVNAGLQEHSLGVLGLHQTVLSIDGQPYQYTKEYVVQTMGGGQTSDTLVTVPGTAVLNSKYAIYNAGSQQLHNNGVGPFGGIMTFIETTDGSLPPTGGPLADNLNVSPNPVTSNVAVTLTADLDTTSTSGLNITEWEYFITSIGIDGTGTTMPVNAPAPMASVTSTIPAATLSSIPSGDVTIYLHGKDANGTWGPVNSVVFDLIGEGPVITSINLNSSPANGELPVNIQATADSTIVGDTSVVNAEYFIGTPGTDGSGTAMTLNQQAPISSLTAAIDAATIQTLPEGAHTIHIHALDALGNWGGYGTIDLVVDKTGPAATGLRLTPNPNNGSMSVNSSSLGALLEISLTDFVNIETSEAFINYTNPTSNPNGTGFSLIASDAVYDSNSETAYFIIPLTTIRFLAEGEHLISFHGKDVAGNWGPMDSMTLVIDKTGPTTSSISATPNPITRRRRQRLILSALGIEDVATVMAAEWFEGDDPGLGQGMPMVATDGTFDSATEAVATIINVSRWSFGFHTVSVRTQDSLGNWGDVMTTAVEIRRRNANVVSTVFDDSFETDNFSGWNTAVGNVNVTAASALNESLGMDATLTPGETAYLQAQLPNNFKSYDFGFDFNPNNVVTGDDGQEIFVALDSAQNALYGITFEQDAVGGAEIKAWALQADESIAETESIQITNGSHRINLKWDQENHNLNLIVDGIVQATMSGIDGAAYQMDAIKLGPSREAAVGASGSMFFDAIEISVAPYEVFMPIVTTSAQE